MTRETKIEIQGIFFIVSLVLVALWLAGCCYANKGKKDDNLKMKHEIENLQERVNKLEEWDNLPLMPIPHVNNHR